MSSEMSAKKPSKIITDPAKVRAICLMPHGVTREDAIRSIRRQNDQTKP